MRPAWPRPLPTPSRRSRTAIPRRDYSIVHSCPEFTAVCPKTGQPDFATLVIRYVPDRLCVELKSLKLYLQGYRNRGIFYEQVVNVILDDLVAAIRPRHLSVEGRFDVRGGISSVVTGDLRQARQETALKALTFLARRFVAGETSEAAIEVGKRLHAKGILATFDLLGRTCSTRDAARRAAEAQKELLRLIPADIERNISIKLSSLGQEISRDFCLENAASILDVAQRGLGLRATRHGGLEDHAVDDRPLPRAPPQATTTWGSCCRPTCTARRRTWRRRCAEATACGCARAPTRSPPRSPSRRWTTSAGASGSACACCSTRATTRPWPPTTRAW